MIRGGIPGEKKCEVCECTFVNKSNTEAKRCVACEGLGPEAAASNEKFIYQDVKRSDVEAKLNLCLSKLDAILKLMSPRAPKEYSKKCETCGQVFVSDSPGTKYCESCKMAAKVN